MTDSDQVSIITVSYNAADTIRKTIESVLHQTYDRIEYIIIDGSSTDETYQIICEYDKKFADRNITYIHISEPDRGIYDAMNKGVGYCSGEWIYYLNANDRLFQNSTLEQVFSKKYGEQVSCIYGNTWNVKEKKLYFKRAYDIETIYYRVPFVHQAAFVRRGVMERYRFDMGYKVSADYDLFTRMYVNGEKYKKIDCDIALFDLSGISQNSTTEARNEREEIQIKNGLYGRYRVRRFFQNNIIYALKKSRSIYNVYIFCMNLRRAS